MNIKESKSASAEIAGQWEQFEKDGDRYLLLYRTVGDERVRQEHAELHRVTLPLSSSFWDEHFPPNGWNCRCSVVQVRKGKHPETDLNEANARAEASSAKDPKGIFRFNAGKEKKAIPDYNPYTISKCKTCPMAKGKGGVDLAKIPDNELCGACRVVRRRKKKPFIGIPIDHDDRAEWEHTYISPHSQGYVVTRHQRIRESQVHPHELEKYKKELRMSKALADNGYIVEHLPDTHRPPNDTHDIMMDGIKADLKCITGGAGNVVNYGKDAFRKQGATAVVYEFPAHDKKYYKAMNKLLDDCPNNRVFYYFRDEGVVREIPSRAIKKRRKMEKKKGR